jgi:hypothetical protein
MRTGLTALIAIAAMTVAQGSVDLAEILAPPPTSDYLDSGGAQGGLTGAFDAHQYAVWLTATPSDAPRIENILRQEGFLRGYARSWTALSSTKASIGGNRHNRLIETVEEYNGGAGAQARYDGVVKFTRSGQMVREIAPPVAHAFGAVTASGYSYFVMFVKGNDVYIVRMGSEVDDMTAIVVVQAKAQFAVAPPYTIAPSSWVTAPSPDNPVVATAKTVLVGALIFGTAVLRVVLLYKNRRQTG